MASVQELVPTHGLVAACRVLGLWRGAPARQQAALRRDAAHVHRMATPVEHRRLQPGEVGLEADAPDDAGDAGGAGGAGGEQVVR